MLIPYSIFTLQSGCPGVRGADALDPQIGRGGEEPLQAFAFRVRIGEVRHLGMAPKCVFHFSMMELDFAGLMVFPQQGVLSVEGSPRP
jgi:hypothetical protein